MSRARIKLSLATAAFLALVAHPSDGKAAGNSGNPDARDYRNCVALSANAPAAAHEVAADWLVAGGGIPAQHCAALSLAALGRYGEAAGVLEAAAEDLRIAERKGTYTGFFRRGEGLVGEMLGQAGNAWLLAGDAIQAYTAFTNALTEVEPNSQRALELTIDRARASGVAGDYAVALEDLDRAAEQAAKRVEIFVLRASAYRNLGRPEEAAADLGRAFALAPEDREALLESGNLRLMMNDAAGAGADWQRIMELYPESPAAALAARNLDRLAAEIPPETKED
jgi:tetratricopeptide (TPR) repeat protein